MSISAMDELDFQDLLGEEEWIFEDILYKGRYGSVVKAKEVLTGGQFAIKVVEYESDDQRKYRKRELRLLEKNASMHKDNVMRYYHSWVKKYIGSKFLVMKMELCYSSLDIYMKEMSREETQAGVSTCISIVKDANLYKFVFPQILNGLDGIHTMTPKWVHRDISLANILVQLPCPKLIQEIQIKIGDFGLARELPVEAGVYNLSHPLKLDAIRKDSAERTLYQAPAVVDITRPTVLTSSLGLSAVCQDSERTLFQALAGDAGLSCTGKLHAVIQDPERTLYEAPELSGHSYCEKVDMYSAGIVLYLLTSYPENQNENQWPSDVEIRALRNGQRDRSDLCHDDEVLAELLFSSTSSLLHENPKKRPSAGQALCKLPLQRNKCVEDRDFDRESEISFQATINLLSQKFTVINKSLGKGSYARVVSVKHRIDGRQYAVKIIKRKDVPEKYKKRELSILTKQVDSPISHNNIVRYYDSWEEIVNGHSILFIQMELCNKSLRSILQEKPHIVDNEVLHKHVFKQILRALMYIHDSGFVHRDIYPPNILVSTSREDTIETWVVKLADFGLARMIDQPPQSNPHEHEEKLSSSAGNRYYRAPEMWKDSYGKKVDIYSAGVVLYRLSCCLKDDKEIEDALFKLQEEKKVDRNILSVRGERLYVLLNRLVEGDPEKRPNARQAEIMFSKYMRNENSHSDPRIEVLSLGEANDTLQGGSSRPHERRRDDDVSRDETDSKSGGRLQPVELEEDEPEVGFLC